ncbi:MAG: ABC transporter permease, partial [Actinomycetota bacterium]|nr:ABC transporter permease [Actinomycetota bacterium]
MSFRRFTVGAALTVFGFYALLIASLGYFFDPGEVAQVWGSERTLFTIKLSMTAATLAASAAMMLAIPAAYALSRFEFTGRLVADTILEFPIIVSPAALGAILLIFFNNPLGEWIQEHLITFVFAFAGIVLAQFVTILGIATRLVKTALDEIPDEYERVARSLGASPLRAFATITLPLARRGMFTAFVLAWAKALGEFGATITVAGTMAMRTETLPVAIYMRLSGADIEGTVAMIILLLTIGLG